MNILVNVPYSLFEKRSEKKYIGPLHFSNMLIKSFAKTPHSFTAVVFEKVKPTDKPYFKSRVVRDGKNRWLVLNVWLPTAKILAARQKVDPETRKIIEGLTRAISATKPDVFFLNGFSALTFLLMQAVGCLKTPMISTHHGIWYREYMALRKDLVKSPIKFRKELEMDTVRLSKKNVFLSKLSLQVFEKNLMKVPKSQLEFVKIPYNPVFANKKLPAPSPKSEKLNVLMVGRWDAVKNHEAYLEIAKAARTMRLPWNFYSVCNITDYPHYDHIKDEYRKYVKVLGTMSAEDLKRTYRKSHVIVVPSHFDVYPGVVTECLLQNRPALISPNVGWIDEFTRHGLRHWVDNFKSPKQTLKKIKQLSRESVPKALYDEVLARNNPGNVLKKYFSMFEEISQVEIKRTK
jgi:glycosyltransferase involved in cell wall biosynthesis